MPISRPAQAAKRTFDILGAALGLSLAWWLIVCLAVVAALDTRSNGFYVQTRIGRGGRPFRLLKLRTMTTSTALDTTVTAEDDPRITRIGRLLRRSKLDELPQLINVLIGD